MAENRRCLRSRGGEDAGRRKTEILMPNDGRSNSETDRRPKLYAQAEERCSVRKLKTRTKELLALAFWNSSQPGKMD